MDEAGIDVDPADGSVGFRMKNGWEGVWGLSSKEVDRLARRAKNTFSGNRCSRSRMTTFAVNLHHLSFFHLRFGFNEVAEKKVEQQGTVLVYLADSAKPLVFDAAPDPEHPKKEKEDEETFGNLLRDLETMDEYPNVEPMIDLLDIDGERAFFSDRASRLNRNSSGHYPSRTGGRKRRLYSRSALNVKSRWLQRRLHANLLVQCNGRRIGGCSSAFSAVRDVGLGI